MSYKKIYFFFALFSLFQSMESLATNKEEVKMAKVKIEKDTFAVGCFWCTQHSFDKLKVVISTTVGYTGVTKENPTYEEVCSVKTGHAEALEITYDPQHVLFFQNRL